MGKTQNTSVLLITLTLKALCSYCSSFATWIQPDNLNMATVCNSRKHSILGGVVFSLKKKQHGQELFHSSLTLWLTALSLLKLRFPSWLVMSLPRNQWLLWVSGGPWSPDYPGKAEWCLLCDHPGKGVPWCILTSYSLGSKWTPRFLKLQVEDIVSCSSWK